MKRIYDKKTLWEAIKEDREMLAWGIAAGFFLWIIVLMKIFVFI